jgi:hypothetical protein
MLLPGYERTPHRNHSNRPSPNLAHRFPSRDARSLSFDLALGNAWQYSAS